MTNTATSVFAAAGRLTGNTAKLQVLQELVQALDAAPAQPRRILDVGCAGSRGEFDLWAPLLADPRYSSRFRLYGVDVQGIERAQRYARERGWRNVELRTASAYELASAFPQGFFDILVSTQVMEHLRHRRRFLQGSHAVLRDGGTAYLTMDSGHYPRKGPGGLAGLNSWATRAFAHLRGNAEQHYDTAVYDHDIEALFAQVGLAVEDKRFYCLHPLKEIHNHKVAQAHNQLLQRWKELEDLLNAEAAFIAGNKHYFMALYYKLRRQPAPLGA